MGQVTIRDWELPLTVVQLTYGHVPTDPRIKCEPFGRDPSAHHACAKTLVK